MGRKKSPYGTKEVVTMRMDQITLYQIDHYAEIASITRTEFISRAIKAAIGRTRRYNDKKARNTEQECRMDTPDMLS